MPMDEVARVTKPNPMANCWRSKPSSHSRIQALDIASHFSNILTSQYPAVMIATIVSPGSIPEFVHPPVPGESHDLYGDSHLDSIKLPVSAARRSPSGSAVSRSIQSADPLGVESSFGSRANETSTPAPSSRSDPARESTSGATPVASQDSIEGSSDDILWARLVENCINGQADLVQEILTLSPQLKDSIDNVSTATGMNPLHFAASRGHEEIVRILIDQAGAGVDAPDREGEVRIFPNCGACEMSMAAWWQCHSNTILTQPFL